MDDTVLLESRSMRQQYCKEENTWIIDRIGQLSTLSNTAWATSKSVAAFYQVPESVIKQTVRRNLEELEGYGYKVLSKNDLEKLLNVTFAIPNRGLAIFPRRAILRIGMILRDSLVAKAVRSHLLNIEQLISTSNGHQNLQHIAKRLSEQAISIAENAHQLKAHANRISENADLLISHARMVEVLVDEMYQNRRQIETLNNRVFLLEDKVLRQDKPTEYLPSPESFITQEQIRILKKLVKEKEQLPVTIWRKFNQHFNISRYRFLPQHRFQEALNWLQNNPLTENESI